MRAPVSDGPRITAASPARALMVCNVDVERQTRSHAASPKDTLRVARRDFRAFCAPNMPAAPFRHLPRRLMPLPFDVSVFVAADAATTVGARRYYAILCDAIAAD